MDILCLMAIAFNVHKHLVSMEHVRVVALTLLEHNLLVLTAFLSLILTLSFIQEDAWSVQDAFKLIITASATNAFLVSMKEIIYALRVIRVAQPAQIRRIVSLAQKDTIGE